MESVVLSGRDVPMSVFFVQQENDLKLDVPQEAVSLLIRDGKSWVVDKESGFAMDVKFLADHFYATNDFSQWLTAESLEKTSLQMFVAGYPTRAYRYRNDKGQRAYLYFSENAVLRALMQDANSLLAQSPASGFSIIGATSKKGVLLALEVDGRFVMKVTKIKPATFGEALFRFPPKGILTMNAVIERLKELSN